MPEINVDPRVERLRRDLVLDEHLMTEMALHAARFEAAAAAEDASRPKWKKKRKQPRPKKKGQRIAVRVASTAK